MASRRLNYRLAKIHRTYTVPEAARLFGIHRNTVREWIKRGLATTDLRRPLLILGCDLRAFLLERRRKNKRPCLPGQIYCVRCRLPREPAGDLAEYQPVTATQGNLVGICPNCDTMIYRRVSVEKLPLALGELRVSLPKAS